MQQPVKYYRERSIGKLTSRDSVQLLRGAMCQAVNHNVDEEKKKRLYRIERGCLLRSRYANSYFAIVDLADPGQLHSPHRP
jgi:hypothetical protein